MDKDIKDYKKIIKKHGLQFSNEEIVEIAKNIQDLAEVFVQFAKNKNQQKENSDKSRRMKLGKKSLPNKTFRN